MGGQTPQKCGEQRVIHWCRTWTRRRRTEPPARTLRRWGLNSWEPELLGYWLIRAI